MVNELKNLKLKSKIIIILSVFLIYLLSNFIGSVIENVYFIITKSSFLNLINIMFYTNIIFILLFILLFRIIKIKVFKYSLKNISKNNLKNLGIIGVITIIFSLILSGFINYFKLMPENQNIIETLAAKTNTSILFLSLVVFAPIAEELIFRYTIFGLNKNKFVGLIISSILFALVHVSSDFAISSFFIYFSMGMLFGLIYIKTESVEATIFAHFINNVLSFIELMF